MTLLMNMLISRRAGRGERASPVLFLLRSDERGRKRGMEKRERGRERRKMKMMGEKLCVLSERGKKRRAEEENAGRRGVWKYIYEIPGVQQISIVAIWTVASPCCAILCWRQMNHPC